MIGTGANLQNVSSNKLQRTTLDVMQTKNLTEIISDIDNINEELVLFSKRIDGHFKSNSETVVIELNEEERELPTHIVAEKKCPGFEYFMEVFLVKEFVDDYKNAHPKDDIIKLSDRLAYYAEFDA
jgi:hypothetical protein